PSAVKEISDSARGSHFAAGALEDFANLATGAIAVIGKNVYQDCHTTRAIALVSQLFENHTIGFTGAAFDGPIDVILGHADLASLVDGVAQLQIHAGIAAAV